MKDRYCEGEQSKVRPRSFQLEDLNQAMKKTFLTEFLLEFGETKQ